MRAALGLGLLAAGPAMADPCADLAGLAEGPVAVGIRPGELGRGHRVCGRTELALGGSVYLLADAPNFYGHIVGTADVDGSWSVSEGTELYGGLELVRYDSVLAPLPDTTVGPGWATAGLARRLATGKRAALGINGKVAVPLHYRTAFPLGVDLALAGVWAPARAVRMHAQIGAVGEANAGAGPTQAAAGFASTAGLALRPGSAFAFALDLVGSFGSTAAVDHLAVAPAFRFSDGERVGVELGLAAPLAGRERALALADLRITGRW